MRPIPEIEALKELALTWRVPQSGGCKQDGRDQCAEELESLIPPIEKVIADELFARDPDLFRKLHELLEAHEREFPAFKSRSAATFYVCARCGLLYQSMYGCGCPLKGSK